jgi:hypothetical protein
VRIHRIFITIESVEFKSKRVGERFGFPKYQSRTPFLIPVKIFFVPIDAISSYIIHTNQLLSDEEETQQV